MSERATVRYQQGELRVCNARIGLYVRDADGDLMRREDLECGDLLLVLESAFADEPLPPSWLSVLANGASGVIFWPDVRHYTRLVTAPG